MRCLLVGGGGFLGAHIAEAALSAGHAVRIFDRALARQVAPPHLRALDWVEGDFTQHGDLEPAVQGCDVVVHLVSTTVPATSNQDPVYDVTTNVLGSLHLLQAAQKAGVRRVVFISSGGTVYGETQVALISEDYPTAPICSYGITKLAIEKYLHLFERLHGMGHVILRVANPYGEHQRKEGIQGAVGVFLGRALADQEIEIWGDGGVVRDYVYAGDVADAVVRAFDYAGNERIFNIGSGAGISLNDLVAAIARSLGRKVKTKFLPGRAFDVPVSVLDIARARSSLGWSPQMSLDEGLARLVATRASANER